MDMNPPKKALGSHLATSSVVLYPRLRGIVHLSNFNTLRFRKWCKAALKRAYRQFSETQREKSRENV